MEISCFSRTLCPMTSAMNLQFVYVEPQKAAQISYGTDLTHQQSSRGCLFWNTASSQELETQVKTAIGPGAGRKTLLSPPIHHQVLFLCQGFKGLLLKAESKRQTWSPGTQRANMLAVHVKTGTLSSMKQPNPKSLFPCLWNKTVLQRLNKEHM